MHVVPLRTSPRFVRFKQVGYEVQTARGAVAPWRVAPRFVINFPTKKHWRNPSKLEYIEAGLIDLLRQVRALEIRSLAMPPLGCGNGGLDWPTVRLLIMQAFDSLPDVRLVLFEPVTTSDLQVTPLIGDLFGGR